MNAKRILSIEVKLEPDTDPDTSYLGKYSDCLESDFAIDREHSTDCASQEFNHRESVAKLERVIRYLDKVHEPIETAGAYISEATDILIAAQESLTECDCNGGDRDRNEYRYFNPATVESFNPQASWIPADVTDKRAYWHDAMKKNALADYARMESLQKQDWHYLGISAVAKVQTGDTIQRLHSGGLWGIESDSGEGYLKEIEAEQVAELRGVLYDFGFSKRAIAAAVKQAGF